MTLADTPSEGDTATFSRTFRTEEVRRFAELSKDEGTHHVTPDSEGKVVLHGLLTATMPTKLGGDIDYVARTMTFEFPSPAYTGVEITCETTVERVERHDGRTEMDTSFVCETPDGTVVLRGETTGVLRD
jgi:3-hydroxybutyryl-CoA dehydratase